MRPEPSGVAPKRSFAGWSVFRDPVGPIPEFPDLPDREVIVAPYRFFDRVAGRIVRVIGVWHGTQLPTKPTA